MAALTALFDEARAPATGERAAVIDDMAALAAWFADVAGTTLVDIRVDRITGDACWKFHRDHVRLRMLVSYRGPGTEWVSRGQSETAILQQRDYRGPVHRFPRFAVGLFKGGLAGPEAGIVHRSPPIAGTETVRLLLCLNLPSPASPALFP